ncbi:signal peptidase I [Rhodoferax ferrireducens]|uniref:signal peptidase I n=1 Tax=Rhodoferax ferrireducens TaxID=192843 RepID=UPI0018E56AF3|nr:signal peptidase I [Rhodoferax ferrireducens]
MQITHPASSPVAAPLPDAVMTPRKPLLAALASLVLPGFGQLYNGDLNRAIWLFLSFTLLCIPAIALVALYLPARLMLPTLLLGLVATLGVWGYAVWDAWRTARLRVETPAKAWQLSGVYVLVFVLCDLLALPLLTLYVRQHQVEPFRIPSSSMEPSVRAGDMIWADKRYNCPGCQQGVHRGDIAIFAYPNDRSVRYIKRVIGLPGDHIELKNQQVWVNGQTLQRSATPSSAGTVTVTEAIGERQWQVQWVEPVTPVAQIATAQPLNRAQTAPAKTLQLTVPDGQVFVLGDNRQASIDSRSFGTVPMQDILGRARQVWFSSDSQGVRWARLGQVLE